MRTRARLLLTFLGAHLVLTLAMGAVAWLWLDASMRAQAQDSARALARVISQGGFPLTPEVMDKMRTLTGYRFGVLPARTQLRPGTVQVEVEGRVVEVDYLTATYLSASTAVLVGTLAVTIAGTVGFGLLSLWLSGQFATPLERLARAARTIGSGDLEATVAVVGSGEVRELALELEHMRARLIDLDRQHRSAERLAAIGTFTATIAHEVRNPLSAVRLIVQMLAMRPGPEGQDPSLRLVMDELERLDLIVDELLAFSKGMSVQPVACDLRAVAETVVRLLRRQAEHAGVELSVSGQARVQADPARLRQLLMNLVLNAIQAQHAQGGGAGGAEQRGNVRVLIASDGLSVSDDGPGVDPALVPQLFEPFASSRPHGAGLGLHLARAISDAHGGLLSYQAQDRGACFTLSGLKPAPEQPNALAGDQEPGGDQGQPRGSEGRLIEQRGGRLGAGRARRRRGGPGSFAVRGAGRGAGGVVARLSGLGLGLAEELHGVGDDLQAAALAALLVLPGIELEAALEVAGAALGEVLPDQLGGAPPGFAIDEGDLLLHLAIGTFVTAVDGQAEADHGAVVGERAQLGIAGEVSGEHHGIEVEGHACSCGVVSDPTGVHSAIKDHSDPSWGGKRVSGR